jgi:hypothetical protein
MDKKITYGKKDYFYELDFFETDFGHLVETKIYEEGDIYYEKKYIFFGPQVRKVKYNFLFTLEYSIENPEIDKASLRFDFSRELAKLDVLNIRKKEIEKGNFF